MNKALVNRILPFSPVDGPGNRTVIFLQGCNFNCLYCHNPETINCCTACGACVPACPAGALAIVDRMVTWNSTSCIGCDSCLGACSSKSSPKAVFMSPDEVMKVVFKVRPFISGITVTGGECTLQKEFLAELIEKAHASELTVFIDTNGSLDFSKEDRLTELMDAVMLDIKSFNEEEHKMLTGMSNKTVLKNAGFLAKRGKLYEIRTVIVPGILDNLRNVSEISSMISRLDSDIRYKLIRFRPIGVQNNMENVPVPSDAHMEQLREIAEEKGCRNIIVA